MDVILPPKHRIPTLLLLVLGFGVGAIFGASLFRSFEPRTILAWNACADHSCLRVNEVIGLAAAVGVKYAPDLLPQVILETPYSIALRHPLPEDRVHYIIIPKQDIKNIGELKNEDQVYLLDAFAVMQELVKRDRLQTYFIRTSGPGYQDVAYLHFHLLAK